MQIFADYPDFIGSTGFQGALALPDPPHCISGWMQRAPSIQPDYE